MPDLTTFLLLSFAVYACIKWWFDSDILDHLTCLLFSEEYCEFKMVRDDMRKKGKFKSLLVELFECPWCLAFHFSLWLNILVSFNSFNFIIFVVQTIATAGLAMFLWQKDLTS